MGKKIKQKTVICTVSNDLIQDQRMHRICTTMYNDGFQVLLLGRKKKQSLPLLPMPFEQHRLYCFFQRGFLFYAEFNFRLFVFLCFRASDIIYSVDLDTIIPGCVIKKIKGNNQIFDAHEYFVESPELTAKPWIQKWWLWIEKNFVSKADLCITVNESLATIFQKRTQTPFFTIYNVPSLALNTMVQTQKGEAPILLYQGMLNMGRGIKEMIAALEMIPQAHLHIIGEGDLSDVLRRIAYQSPAADRIYFLGWLDPAAMALETQKASLGLNLLDKSSLNYYYSLANKFFDYMHVGLPSINMRFPEYEAIQAKYDVCYLVDDLDPNTLSDVINRALTHADVLAQKKTNCIAASQKFNWQKEADKLLSLVHDRFGHDADRSKKG